ncbi:MAG: ATP-binding cassette domain-containing protein [Alphaproteobacteria bacterium]|jgi:lipoprotein-releasing system ATP-binding protein|nr:ATP-binding cassette domain-containing protein [Alphaproteobacteria bacterium]
MSEPGGGVPLLRLDGVTRSFNEAGHTLEVLRGVALSIDPGEMVALVGPSGAGKSTLLHISGLLERPTAGAVLIDGQEAGTLSDQARTALRRAAIGFVYQFHHLLPEFTALENVALPQIIAGVTRRQANEAAGALLQRVGLAERLSHRPSQLSGGEQQRVAIARALSNRPKLLLADEPTGNLDQHTADDVFDLLQNLVKETRTGALVATHNLALAGRMDRVLDLRDGAIVSR